MIITNLFQICFKFVHLKYSDALQNDRHGHMEI